MNESQHFWYLRIMHLTGADLSQSEGENWEEAYHDVLQCVRIGFESEYAIKSRLVTYILLRVGYDPSVCNNKAIIGACQAGNIEVVSLLLSDKRVDPTAQKNSSVALACCHSVELVALLLADKRVNPSDDNNRSIMLASLWGTREIVELLLSDPRVDPRAENNEALYRARHSQDPEIIKLIEDRIRQEEIDNN